MVVFFRGLRDGLLTTRWPKHPDTYFDEFPAAVEVLPGNAQRDQLRRAVDAAARCPTAAIAVAEMPKLDRGKCILCGRCVAAAPDWFGWAHGADTARSQRDALVVSPVPETDEALDGVRAELAKRVRRLRRSVHLRHVDAGSDGSDEWEVQALTNPVYDLHRLGIFFTASPRHADILLVTGIGAAGMTEPLRRTLEAMPRPTVVIAVGTDAICGGLVGGGYTGGTGIGGLLPVDVWIPGSPASPFSLLHGILLALGRLPAASRRAS
ncbi:4Fe-4S single cluster domain protein [Mycobacterium kansasii 732]|uniref:Formate hydrogenlyase subunit 7 n=1 Tax=Mycobacterium pseudokansasii TaxID=2341080 RepID=A0A498QW79_9MYCO|nr:NADH:ubiquinone oxidoreductase [Mycobacterium pseudokansasii]EUA11321.1 4Fe-4S single cluster domain protein [Mycobacterium kansasii 732]KZS68051.1 NADH:ubiquinone oxidoreductase [Mycobacterium kansasii]MBY0391134.1 NADH:ubiquinone oxidoreductase [Mycobacterium pseudokansasii]VAZ99754.1 Formate hydrogenlyase subunit 7 [Mycobacterium pseudokansasii]VBA30962.1 Formate hydrogenlyase subunit 7 [Mycobacterium pseudokansasii]